MLLADYQPRPALVTQSTEVLEPRLPVIDMHNHFGAPFDVGWDKRPVAELLERLEEAGVSRFVDLDGGWGEETLSSTCLPPMT